MPTWMAPDSDTPSTRGPAAATTLSCTIGNTVARSHSRGSASARIRGTSTPRRASSIDGCRVGSHTPPMLLGRSEEHTSELQSLMRTSYDAFCLKKQKHIKPHDERSHTHT